MFDAVDPVSVTASAAGAALDTFLGRGDVVPVLRGLFASSAGELVSAPVASLAMPVPSGVRHKDNLDHSIRVAGQCPTVRLVRWAALFHDVGKPSCRRIGRDGTVSFAGHETVGAQITAGELRRFGFGDGFVDDVAAVVALSGRAAEYEPSWTDAAVRRFLVDAGSRFDAVCALARADCTSRFAENRRRAHVRIDALREHAVRVRARDAVRSRRPPLDGAAIMQILDVGPGPLVGDAIAFLMVACPDADRATASVALRAWHAERSSG